MNLSGAVRYRQGVSEHDAAPVPDQLRTRNGAARQSALRNHNLALVLERIAAAGTISRAEVAAQAGLTRATVSSLVELLLEAGVLEWAPVVAGGAVGRPASPVRLARGTWAGLGLEVGANHLCASVVDLAGEQLAFQEVRGDFAAPTASAVTGAIAHLGSRTWQQAAAASPGLRPLGVTLAVPGIVRGAVVLDSPRLGWQDVAVAELLETGDLPTGTLTGGVEPVNEATLAAHAESHARGGASTFLYVSGGVGVGGALVVDGAPQQGQNGFAGELGHITVDPDGPPCRCGSRGCLEQYAGGEALSRRSPAEAGRALGIALSSAVNVLDVSTIVLGGTLGRQGEVLAEAMSTELELRVLAYPWSPVRLETALVEEFPGLRGAALRPVVAVLGDPDRLVSRGS